MFMIRSLILSCEVILVSGDYRKRSHTSTAFRACTDFGSLLAKNSVGRLFCRQIPSFSLIYISFLN